MTTSACSPGNQIAPFDLQARAELAIHGLTALLDPERPGVMYFLANWRARPPRADHGLWDCGDGSGRHVDALTLARSMVRKDSPAAAQGQAERDIEAWMTALLGAEGLTWLTADPWAEPWGRDWLLADQRPSPRYAEISWAQRGTLMGLISRFLATSEERYLDRASRLVDGLLRIAVRHGDGLFFPEGYYRADGWHSGMPGLAAGIEETNAVVIVPALRLYEITQRAAALELAEGLFRYALKHTEGYLPDGGLRGVQGGPLQEHFHTRSCFILGALKLGLVTGRREYIAWARQSYARAREFGTDFGWFPEGLGHRHGEICGTTDMIEIALLLGRHVDSGYYADAERFGRNHLLESQFLSLDRLQCALDLLPADDAPPPWDGRYSTADRVAAHQVGGFASRPTLNDAFHLDATWLMQCCNAAGARGIYDLWRYAVNEIPGTGGELPCETVNLRFSVETPAIRVVSHEPREGRLDITACRACRVRVRLPAGAQAALCAFTAPGTPSVRHVPVHDGYVAFPAGRGEQIQVHYPLSEHVAHYEVGIPGRALRCTGHWRGETLMRVDPPGPFYPLYAGREDLEPVEPGAPAGPQIPSL
jgi:hypothetical protein